MTPTVFSWHAQAMRSTSFRYTLLIWAALLLLPAKTLLADDINDLQPESSQSDSRTQTAEQRRRLQGLRNTITSLQGSLSRERDKHSKLRTKLRRSEKAIGKKISQIKSINRQLKKQQGKLRALKSEQQDLQDSLNKQRDVLAGQIRTSYAMGRQEYMKLLLNQQDPAALGRTMVLYDYLNRARTKRIGDIEQSTIKLAAIGKDINKQTAKLKNTRVKRLKQKNALQQTVNKRTKVLNTLNKNIRTREQKLEQVRTDARQLETLLLGLRQALADIPADAGKRVAFNKQKGRLKLPVKGRITSRYGSRRKSGKLRWQGVMISAKPGSQVETVSHGRVAFADWLRGFGLMVIVDHGDGYMSLYGHNESLYVETGDWVESGEAISTVGNSGGRKKPALYFEIRKNGKPTNPLRWCKR